MSTAADQYEKPFNKKSVLDIDTDNECSFAVPSLDGDSDMHRGSEAGYEESFHAGNEHY